MKVIDFERAALLMAIMEKQANVSPMLTSISGAASQELKAIAEDCRQNAIERADAIRKEEQVAEAKRLEAVKEHDAQNAQPRGPIQPAEGQPYMPGQPDPNVRSSRADGKPDTDPNANLANTDKPDPVIDRRV